MPTVPGHEDPIGRVDPHLLDRRVIQVGLQRPEPAHPRHQLADHRVHVRDRRHHPGQAALVVVAHDRLGDPAYDERVGLWIDALATNHLAHVRVELLDQFVVRAELRRQLRRPGGLNSRHRDPDSREEPVRARTVIPTLTRGEEATGNLWRTSPVGPM